MHVDIRCCTVKGARVLGVWARTVPMLLMAGPVTAAATIVTVPIAVSVVVSRRVPVRLAAFQVWAIRQRVRTFTGLFLLRPDAPPWPGQLSSQDPGDDPRTTVDAAPPIALPRTAPFTHALRATAHLTVLVPIGLALDLLLPVWGVVVARRGWTPAAQRRLVGVERWTAAVLAHAWLVTAEKPGPTWQELRSGATTSQKSRSSVGPSRATA